MVVGGDLNGHVAISREAIERIHVRWLGSGREEQGRRQGNIFCTGV